MSEDLIGEAIVDLGILAVFLLALGVGGLVADHVFPHIPFIQHYLDSLPDFEEEEDFDEQR